MIDLIHAIEEIQDLLLEFQKENGNNTHIERALRICENKIDEYTQINKYKHFMNQFKTIMMDEQCTGGKMFDLYDLLAEVEKELLNND